MKATGISVYIQSVLSVAQARLEVLDRTLVLTLACGVSLLVASPVDTGIIVPFGPCGNGPAHSLTRASDSPCCSTSDVGGLRLPLVPCISSVADLVVKDSKEQNKGKAIIY